MAGTSPRFHGLPGVIYGTAFKDDDTAALVETAIKSGFRAIDTSGNKPQYREALVGQGISAAIASGSATRSQLFIQTKFSPFKAGRDPALYPYDVKKSIPEQVRDSVSSSLANLKVDYIDCLVLHSLYPDMDDTLKAWRAMEELVPETVTSLALSNVDLDALQHIHEAVRITPVSVQNRFTSGTKEVPEMNLPPGLPYPKVPYDRDVRKFCSDEGIAYAPWGLLWGNPAILNEGSASPLLALADEIGITKQVVFYDALRSTSGCKYNVLCGTTKESKMREAIKGSVLVQEYIGKGAEQQKKWRTTVEWLGHLINGS